LLEQSIPALNKRKDGAAADKMSSEVRPMLEFLHLENPIRSVSDEGLEMEVGGDGVVVAGRTGRSELIVPSV
jgi:hypothetical protein